MEKLLAPPPFSQQDFWEAFPTIREEFSGFWGIFWRLFGIFGSRALPGIFSPVFLRISLKNPGSNPGFPSPKSRFSELGSEIPTKFQLHSEQILGWGKKLELGNFPPGSIPNPKILEQPLGLELIFSLYPWFFYGKKRLFPRFPLGKLPVFYKKPGISSFLCRRNRGM